MITLAPSVLPLTRPTRGSKAVWVEEGADGDCRKCGGLVRAPGCEYVKKTWWDVLFRAYSDTKQAARVHTFIFISIMRLLDLTPMSMSKAM